MHCLEKVIGLTRTECECFAGQFEAADKESTSGRYMDELGEFPVALSDIKASAGLCKDMKEKMVLARQNAIAAFKESIFRGLSARFSQSVEPYTGFIGGTAYTKNLALTTVYAGIEIEAKQMHGASLIIKRIDTYFAQTSTFNVLIYMNDILLEMIPVNCVANSRTSNDLSPAIVLPLTDANGTPYKYRIVYESADLVPKDNGIGCGCSSENKLDKYVNRRGVTFNSFNSISTSNYTYGLNLVVDALCGTEELVCDAFNNDPFFRETASASIQRKAVEFLIIDILNSKNINRETITNREQMAANRQILHNKFKNDVQWLTENMKQPKGGCFKCAPAEKTMSIGGIRF